MGSEGSLWNTLRDNMKGQWEAERVENPVNPGMPDVYYTMNNGRMGWIELKHVHSWPKWGTTKIKIEHFTDKQRSFIRRHGRIGGNVWVLVQVAREYFLFDWNGSLDIGELTRQGFYDYCYRSWRNSIDYSELRRLLS